MQYSCSTIGTSVDMSTEDGGPPSCTRTTSRKHYKYHLLIHFHLWTVDPIGKTMHTSLPILDPIILGAEIYATETTEQCTDDSYVNVNMAKWNANYTCVDPQPATVH